MTTVRFYDWETGKPVERASDLDYYVKDHCDQCGKEGYGWVRYVAGATGRCCPVLFLCDICGQTKGG